jgi:hypothetical protein
VKIKIEKRRLTGEARFATGQMLYRELLQARREQLAEFKAGRRHAIRTAARKRKLRRGWA